ncbi:peptide chain release factor N(5)-glutamine methyltransferase [Mucilaginibacter gotjawali]|uniref:Release factor glutamine methyltransferase n=2 Tax=Mucilaginibacter gotjawali TaxID=1550579 RepID=A0A839SEG9_9SPHI|nr:peptide chain release factor N(5)-glutamine methyltransferase [Mucilaginibacter gotjawali]MBB3055948.1 release factor glutamine methyltransferase [Mucilaginibacter gotjawali]BAU54774.1 Release factor glutamine methyltransferase [Mucilaginibacter gotjawali]
MKTIKDVFDDYKTGLRRLYDAHEAEAITLLAVTEITGFSKAKVKAFPEQELTVQQTNTFDDVITQLKTGKPIQYILGVTEFYGLPFKVNPSVLIPRPETEELVEWVISSVGSEQLETGSILDIGTGSGCIAISLKKNLPQFKVFAIDISDTALQTAKENAELNNVDIEFINEDILHPKKPFSFHFSAFTSKIEIIISNPPYVTLHDKTRMHTNVTDFEPHTALFVPEDDPLVFYKAIADFAADNLTPGGLLFFEINESYGEEVVQLLNDKPFKNIELRKDMSGRDRMVMSEL